MQIWECVTRTHMKWHSRCLTARARTWTSCSHSVSISLLDTQNLLPVPSNLSLLMNKVVRRGKRALSCSVFLYVVIFSVSGWLIQRSKRGCDRFPWLFMFLGTPLPSLCFLSTFQFEGKHHRLGLSVPPLTQQVQCPYLCVPFRGPDRKL